MSRWYALARIFLDSGTEYESRLPVTHPSRTYEARILDIGFIDMSIPCPSGVPSVADSRIRVADTDGKWRDLLKTQTPRRRKVEIKLVEENESESAESPLSIWEVDDFEFQPRAVDLMLKSQVFSWIDEAIPTLGTRANFPEMAEGQDEFFIPIITGICASTGDNPQGVIALPHVGIEGSPFDRDRWAVAAHEVWDVTAIYRKLPGEGMFSIVIPDEFEINVEARTIDNVDYRLTFLDFLIEQPEGTEIRADVEGIHFRGGWNGYPPVGYDPDLNPTGDPGALRNPVDFFINMTFAILRKAGLEIDFNATRIMAVRDQLENVGSNSPPTPYLCDGAIVESMTVRSFLAIFLASFQLDFFVDRNGQYTLNFTDETDPARPLFSEHRVIKTGTWRERRSSPCINRLNYNFTRNYATNEWADRKPFDNVADQLTLGYPLLDPSGDPEVDPSGDAIRIPRIEEEPFNLFFVRDAATALDVTLRRASFMAIGSYRQEFALPFTEVRDQVELGKLVGLKHSYGLDTGGYTNKEAKITDLVIDLNTLSVTVRSILRIPQTITVPVVYDEGGEALLRGRGLLEAEGEDAGVIVHDNFNRTDSNSLGSNWTELEGSADNFKIVSSRLVMTRNNSIAFRNDCGDILDTGVELVLRDLQGGDPDGFQESGVAARCSGTTVANMRGYVCTTGRNGTARQIVLWRRDAGSSVSLAAAAYSTNPGDVLRLEVTGSGASISLEGFINGVSKVTFADTDSNRIAIAGQPGIGSMLTSDSCHYLFDDFFAETI